MKKSLVAVMLGLMMAIAMTGCGGCGAEEVLEAIEEATEEETEVETEVETEELTDVGTKVTEEVTETTEEPAEEETSVEETSPYTYTELNQVMYAQSTVNVRDLPEQTGGKIGSLTTNQEVTVTGQCNETGWYRISYNGGEGFVSNSYLGTEKVAVSSSSSSGGSSGSSTPAASEPVEESDPYAGMTLEEASDSIALTPDVWYCWYCAEQFSTEEEADAHMLSVHGVDVNQ